MGKKYGYIYKIENTINGKIYIGQTTRCFDSRYSNNLEKNTSNRHLKKSIEKYGIENFEIDKEFDIANNQQELNEKEIYYINLFNTTNPKLGYNKTNGGSEGKRTEEVKDSMKKRYNIYYDGIFYQEVLGLEALVEFTGLRIEIIKKMLTLGKQHIDIKTNYSFTHSNGDDLKSVPKNYINEELTIESIEELLEGEQDGI